MMVNKRSLSPDLKTHITLGSIAAQDESGIWLLKISSGPAGTYRLAQLDDYASLKRDALPWKSPCSLSLQARACRAKTLPGTWGFGFWNDPFSLSLGLGGGSRRFPALPNTAWFFFASPPNYLSFQDDLPARGKLAATFHSPQWHSMLLASTGLLLPLAAIPAIARLLRRAARRFIQQDAAQLQVDQAEWHSYQIDWREHEVSFSIDGERVLQTSVVPHGPLGLVLWIDNQYATLPSDGRLRYGTLENPESAWIEIRHITMTAR
jgi:hypothetical protein